MPDTQDPRLLALYDQALALCGQWEEWADQQFAALRRGDLAALLTVNAYQARLAERLFWLEAEYRKLEAAGKRVEANGIASGLGATVRPAAELYAKRRELLSAIERVFAVDHRNISALNAMDMLGVVCEPLAAGNPGQVYDRKGTPGGHSISNRVVVDREG